MQISELGLPIQHPDGISLRIGSIDLERYPFPRLTELTIGLGDLRQLHGAMPTAGGVSHSDQNTEAHQRFYEGFWAIRTTYDEYIRREVLPQFDEPLYVQAVPTLRVHLPGMTAVQEFHRDSEYGHQIGTANYWIPLTPAHDTTALWLECEPDSGQFEPINMQPGEIMLFDGVQLRHGNRKNRTECTRVSFDFRVVPRKRFSVTSARSVRSRIPLVPGAYYLLVERDGSISQRPPTCTTGLEVES